MEKFKSTLKLREEIEEYITEFINCEIPRVSFSGYSSFSVNGSRKESEREYFNVRKQLTALGCCFMWRVPSDKEKMYFNELLWSVANEFTWTLAAHLSYDYEVFAKESPYNIDLFSAETAMCLSELSVIHRDLIDKNILSFIRHQVNERVLKPFLSRSWGWETSRSNWCSVCSSSVGIAAIMVGDDETCKAILERVDRALDGYLNSFGSDGACEEGIGYWVYGFGFLCYYLDVRMKNDRNFELSQKLIDRIKLVGSFPKFTQINIDKYISFSDVTPSVVVPSGLATWLFKNFGVEPIISEGVTSFDFDHCYRYAHISRNILWTDEEVFSSSFSDFVHYFEEKQWFVERKNGIYFGLKCGTNDEEHNHNDVGSFALNISGEDFLVDLGAGVYTADYFGANRYQDIHTRSYWHNVPLINGSEEVATSCGAVLKEMSSEGGVNTCVFDISSVYSVKVLREFTRRFTIDLENRFFEIVDRFIGEGELSVNEGFVSFIEPVIIEGGKIQWVGLKHRLVLEFDEELFSPFVEEVEELNHLNVLVRAYRVGLKSVFGGCEVLGRFQFYVF